MKNIVIVGGGFSGTVAAINLARLSTAPMQITVINHNPVPCRGIAYSTRNGSHLLNVVARNMSALADQSNHFVDWLGTRSEFLDEPVAKLRERFVPRKVYGDYLHNLFQSYAGILAEGKVRKLEIVNDAAKDVVVHGERATVTLVSGQTLEADKVILAVGNQAPSEFRLHGLSPASPRYIGNPWIGWEAKLPAKNQDVLLIGTGLTMVDTFLTLQDLGWQGKIFAVSRNGLLPLSHFKGFDYPNLLDDDVKAISLRKMVALFKQHFHAAKANNLNPAILVDKLRPFTQRIWQNFSLSEKRQFNRRFRTRWNVMRHRIAPEIHQQLQDAIAQKRLEIIKGRFCNCVETSDALKLEVDSNGAKRELKVGAVVNCTGPAENYVTSGSPLFTNLVAHGLVQPDEMNMGIKVAPNFAIIDRTGKSSDMLFALGSLLKGTLWETTAVPELRSQAFRLAETIADQLAHPTAEKSTISEVVEDVMEYSI